jgi:mannose-P-dolichol utilization defect protein 1
MEALEQTLRSVLQPITHNLPAPISNAATQLLGDSCYRSLVHDVTISDSVCLKLAISKALGIAIIGASSIVKIPQLLKLLNSQSAEGISFLSYLLETASYLVTLVYNVRNQFPFSTYGETALIAVQNVAIAVLVLQYSGKGPAAAVFVAGLAAAGYALYNESIVDMGTLQYIQAGAGLLGVASKLPQILAIAKQGGTGQLSAFAVSDLMTASLKLRTNTDMSCYRSSTTSPARLRGSSPLFRRSTISSSSTVSSLDSRSMPYSPRRWCTIGTAPAARQPPLQSSSPAARGQLRMYQEWTRQRTRPLRDDVVKEGNVNVMEPVVLNYLPSTSPSIAFRSD